MKLKDIPLLSILLIATVFISGCIQQQTATASGAGQGQVTQPICAPNWECSTWSECNWWECSTWSGCAQFGRQTRQTMQTRICTDKNNCGVTANKPTESQSCTPQIIEDNPLGPFEIKITGIGDCVSKTKKALDLLRNKAKSHYDTIVKYVGIIECTRAQSGMYVWENPPRYQVGKATVGSGSITDTIWYAGTIAHDAYHSKQYHDYLYENLTTNVPAEVYTGRNAEAQCLEVQYDALRKIGATKRILDYITNVIKSEWWEVPLDKTWW